MTINKDKITISLDIELIEKIDKTRKDVSRSLYINNILKEKLNQGGKINGK